MGVGLRPHCPFLRSEMTISISETNIKNAALALIGADTITSPTDTSKEGKFSKELYPLAVRETFDYPINWAFAESRTELTQLTDAPDFGYDYQYELPSKCRRVVALVDEDGDEVEYEWRREVYVKISGNREIEYDVFLTAQNEAFIKYIRERSDPNKWPGYFTKMVYTRLAVLMCAPLKAATQKKQQLINLWEEAVIEAKIGNGMESADVNDDSVNLDKGNTDVVDAATKNEVSKKYIIERG
jgi:hypothetical protein